MATYVALLIVLIMLTIFGVVGIFNAWTDWKVSSAEPSVSRWRLELTRVGLVFLTLQVMLFLFLFTPLTRYGFLLRHGFQTEFLLLGIGLPCWLLGKTKLRWWLLGSSCFFSVASFFVIVAETAY